MEKHSYKMVYKYREGKDRFVKFYTENAMNAEFEFMMSLFRDCHDNLSAVVLKDGRKVLKTIEF